MVVPAYLSAFHRSARSRRRRGRSRARRQEPLDTDDAVLWDVGRLEEVRDARGAPIWQQLYPTNDWKVATAIVRHAESAGCPAIALTVDLPGPRNNETLTRAFRVDNRPCVSCHVDNPHDMWRRGPMFKGLDVSKVTGLAPVGITPKYLDQLRALVKGRLIIKGVMEGADAVLAVDMSPTRSSFRTTVDPTKSRFVHTVDCLPEVAAAVRGRAPIFIDGGVRRGTDIFKALALGATAVGIGRPQVWGLAAFGEPGVEAVIDILNRELDDDHASGGHADDRKHLGAQVLRSGTRSRAIASGNSAASGYSIGICLDATPPAGRPTRSAGQLGRLQSNAAGQAALVDGVAHHCRAGAEIEARGNARERDRSIPNETPELSTNGASH